MSNLKMFEEILKDLSTKIEDERQLYAVFRKDNPEFEQVSEENCNAAKYAPFFILTSHHFSIDHNTQVSVCLCCSFFYKDWYRLVIL